MPRCHKNVHGNNVGTPLDIGPGIPLGILFKYFAASALKISLRFPLTLFFEFILEISECYMWTFKDRKSCDVERGVDIEFVLVFGFAESLPVLW